MGTDESRQSPEFYRTFSEKKLTRPGGARRARIERARLALLMRHSGRLAGCSRSARDRARSRAGARSGVAILRDRAKRNPGQPASCAGARSDSGVDAADPRARRQLGRDLCGSGARAHVRHRRRARFRRRSAARASAGRGALRRRPRLPERARVLLGHRLHPQLPRPPNGACASCSTTADSRSSQTRPEHRHRHRHRRATCSPARRCWPNIPGLGRAVAVHADRRAAVQGPQESVRNADLRAPGSPRSVSVGTSAVDRRKITGFDGTNLRREISAESGGERPARPGQCVRRAVSPDPSRPS